MRKRMPVETQVKGTVQVEGRHGGAVGRSLHVEARLDVLSQVRQRSLGGVAAAEAVLMSALWVMSGYLVQEEPLQQLGDG